MSSTSVFDEDTSRRVEAIYVTADASRRRLAVAEALQPAAGDRIVDIGTGPGFLPLEIAGMVTPGGEVIGIDSSEAMLGLARARCASMPGVRFEQGDAASLPLADGSCDGAVSVQVFEYMPDVESGLAEMFRVLRPGGRGVIVSTDWKSLVWNGDSDELMERVLSAFATHCPHQQLPRTLAPRLRAAGFVIDDRRVLPQFNPEYDENTFSGRFLPVVEGYVRGKGVTEAEAAEWAEGVRRCGQAGEYFFCANQYLFRVSKP